MAPAPYPLANTRYGRRYYAYLDSAETVPLLLQAGAQHYEACFFFAAAYGYEPRLGS